MAEVTPDQACIKLRAGLLAESAYMNLAGDPKLANPSPPIVAVREREKLETFWSIRPAAKVQFVKLPGKYRRPLVQIGPCGNSLWVPPNYGGYREAYAVFLAAFENVSAPVTGAGYEVDHVYNASRGNFFTYALVRLILVNERVNSQHGSSYETAIGKADAERDGKSMQLLDAMSELKVLGLPPVMADGKFTAEHHAAAREAAALYRISYKQALEGIATMYERAHRR